MHFYKLTKYILWSALCRAMYRHLLYKRTEIYQAVKLICYHFSPQFCCRSNSQKCISSFIEKIKRTNNFTHTYMYTNKNYKIFLVFNEESLCLAYYFMLFIYDACNSNNLREIVQEFIKVY